MAKDWSGNKKSTFVTLGASNHTDKERQKEDFYATDPIAARLLLDVESFEGKKVAMFLKVQFLEGKERKQLFREHPPRTVYVSSSRIMCAKNGEFERMKAGGGSAVAYAWFVWEKGYKGDTIVRWIN